MGSWRIQDGIVMVLVPWLGMEEGAECVRDDLGAPLAKLLAM